jgi:hypothetical protein
MDNVRDTQYPDSQTTLERAEGKRGLKIALDPIRPTAPVIAWNDSGAITDLRPMTASDACSVCFNQAYECLCGGAE